MPKTRLISPGSIPNHKLLKNLQLQGNYLSNDGGDEGISIQDDGDVIINGAAKLYLNDTGGEYLYSNGTNLFIHSGANITSAQKSFYLNASGVVANQDSTTLKISRSNQSTNDQTATLVHIDFDQTGQIASGQEGTNIGLVVDMNCESVTHDGLATITQTAIDINMLAALDGYQTNTGIDIVCGESDNSTGIKLDVTGNTTSTGIYIDNKNGGNDFKNVSSVDATDYFTIATAAAGATTLTTVDTTVGATAHLTLDPDGDLIVSGADVKIDATKKLYFDGGGDTYIHEVSANKLDIVVGTTTQMSIDDGGGGATASVSIPALSKLYFDGGTETYIHEASSDLLEMYVGGAKLATLAETAGSGNYFLFGTTSAGFTSFTTSYGASNTTVNFNTFGQKAEVILTGNTINLNLVFPNVSCNCILKIVQDGDGDRFITNYITYDQNVGNAGTLYFPNGGTKPTLSTGGNATDILSIYWDNGRHIAYGIMSLNFVASS